MNILEFFTEEGQIDLQSYVEYLFSLQESDDKERLVKLTH